MNRFAKLFEVAGEQVLLFTEYDAEADSTAIHQITVVDGVRADMTVNLKGDDQEGKAERYLDNFEIDNAEKLRKTLTDMLSAQ